MRTTFYDILDGWTMGPWNGPLVEASVSLVSEVFYERDLIFFLTEELWDILELINDPSEYMTDKRKIEQIEILMDYELNERAAKAIQLEVETTPELAITVLNADELIEQHPDWFEKSEAMTMDEVADTIKKALDEKKER